LPPPRKRLLASGLILTLFSVPILRVIPLP